MYHCIDKAADIHLEYNPTKEIKMDSQRIISRNKLAMMIIASSFLSQQGLAFSPTFSTTRGLQLPLIRSPATSEISLRVISGTSKLSVRTYTDTEEVVTEEESKKEVILDQDENKDSTIDSIAAKMSTIAGSFDENRLAFPELANGEVTRVFR
jgi:hypothetical protein